MDYAIIPGASTTPPTKDVGSCVVVLVPRARGAEYVLEVGETERTCGMDEFALSVDGVLGGPKEVRDNLELIQEQLETEMEFAGRDIPSKSA